MRLFRISRMNIYQNPHHIIMPLAFSARKEGHSQSTAEKLKNFHGRFMRNSLGRFIFMWNVFTGISSPEALLVFPVSDPPCPFAGVASMAGNCRPLVVHEGAHVWAASWAAVYGSLAGIARGVVGINQVAKVHIFKLFPVEIDRHLNGGHIIFLNFLRTRCFSSTEYAFRKIFLGSLMFWEW